MKKSFFLFLIFLSACNPRPKQALSPTPANEAAPARRAKNLILLIGDGMGLTQITAGMYSNGNKLNLEQFHFIGLHKSYASDDLITDSAAGATSFASGIKTYNAAIGVNNDSLPVRTILEEAEGKGLATGLVATSSITHATPAAFIAHAKSRTMMEAIATFFVKTEIDLFIGGGKKYFDRREEDTRNLYQELVDKGYILSDFTKEELKNINPDPTKNFGYFTADAEPLPAAQGRDYLIPATKLAAQFLKKHSDKGFFMMIEGSQIDWGGHANNSNYIITEMLDFDKAVGAALDFAKADGETLVIVTADHETGGYAINTGSKMDSIVGAFTSDKHTAALIPVFAYGPGAELFTGIYENTAVYDKMRVALGFKNGSKTAGVNNAQE
jgi:alkaline phosphatase